MADRRTALDKDLDRTRREFSRRLLKARREGRLYEEIKAIEREGMQPSGKDVNGHSNGHKTKRK